MMSSSQAIKFSIHVAQPGTLTDEEYYESHFLPFVEELNQFPAEDIYVGSGTPSPKGTKGVESIMTDVGVAVAIELVPRLFGLIKNWVQRDKNRGLKLVTSIQGKPIEIEISSDDLTSEELTELLGLIKPIEGAGD